MQPLRQPGYDQIRLESKETDTPVEPTTIGREEAPYFEPDPMQLAAAESPDEGECDTTLIVTKLSFAEGPRWSFIERGATVVAKIEDKEFWEDVHRRKYKFAEGDRLRVRLRWKIVEKGGKPKADNTVVKVYEVLPRPRQMRLDGGKDDEPPRRSIALKTDTSDTVFVESGAIRETVETAAYVTNVLDTRINTG